MKSVTFSEERPGTMGANFQDIVEQDQTNFKA